MKEEENEILEGVVHHIHHKEESETFRREVTINGSVYSISLGSNDPYDWLRSVLKFHPNSEKMRRHYSSSQKHTVTLTNGKKWFIEELVSPVENDGPGGL